MNIEYLIWLAKNLYKKSFLTQDYFHRSIFITEQVLFEKSNPLPCSALLQETYCKQFSTHLCDFFVLQLHLFVVFCQI